MTGIFHCWLIGGGGWFTTRPVLAAEPQRAAKILWILWNQENNASGMLQECLSPVEIPR